MRTWDGKRGKKGDLGHAGLRWLAGLKGKSISHEKNTRGGKKEICGLNIGPSRRRIKNVRNNRRRPNMPRGVQQHSVLILQWKNAPANTTDSEIYPNLLRPQPGYGRRET